MRKMGGVLPSILLFTSLGLSVATGSSSRGGGDGITLPKQKPTASVSAGFN